MTRERSEEFGFAPTHDAPIPYMHRMVTQPTFTVYVSCTRRVLPLLILEPVAAPKTGW